MNAFILSIGTELTTGQTLDTNAAWLAARLTEMGIDACAHVTVADDVQAICNALRQCAGTANLVLVTGGLGPTDDDITRDALARAMNVELVQDERSLAQIEAYFRRIRRPMQESNRRQALLPAGAAPIDNTSGTAPGIHAKLGRAQVFVMPGVPREMHQMFQRDVQPKIRAAGDLNPILIRRIHCFGAGEAVMAAKIADLMKDGLNPTVGISAHDGVITVRMLAAGSRDDAQRLLDDTDQTVAQRLGNWVFGRDDDTLPGVVASLLIERNASISTAESCTGGLLAKMLTDVSGSSAYFVRGFVTYSNEAKAADLGVPASLIEEHGAVSEEVARAMATGCRRKCHTDYAVSTAGIAGPTGGTTQKPVGLVYVGLAADTGCEVKELRWSPQWPRDAIRTLTANTVLNLIRKTCSNI